MERGEVRHDKGTYKLVGESREGLAGSAYRLGARCTQQPPVAGCEAGMSVPGGREHLGTGGSCIVPGTSKCLAFWGGW